MEVVYKKTITEKIQELVKKEYEACTIDKVDHISVTRDEMSALMQEGGWKLPERCMYQRWSVATFVKEAPKWEVAYCPVIYDEDN